MDYRMVLLHQMKYLLTFGGGRNGLRLKARTILVHVQVISLCFKRFYVVCNLGLIKEANAIFLPL